MKKQIVLSALAFVLAGCAKTHTFKVLSEEAKPAAVQDVMARVADWQMAHPANRNSADWTYGALYAGFGAWAEMADDANYFNWLKASGDKLNWMPHTRIYHADDYVVCQMYLQMYSLYKDPAMLKGARERLDYILKNPSSAELKAQDKSGKDRWWWCDALFMAPPVWAKMSELTGDSRYIDYMNQEWWETTKYLYDTEEHLYFRDDSYFQKRESNGKKIFWSRGNGWVMGGIVRVLDSMPANYPDRAKYVKLYKEMAVKLITLQGADGLWRSSLLDAEHYPNPETSGSGFYCYSLAWGVNRGILDEKTYLPVVLKAWKGLTGAVKPDGKLGWVQPIGADPRKTSEDQTDNFGAGAFLLAGSEVYKIAIANGAITIPVRTANSLGMFRDNETISLPWSSLSWKNGKLTADNAAVFDVRSNRFLVTQIVDKNADGKADELLFQANYAPYEKKTFWVMVLPEGIAKPTTTDVTFGRYVPERYEDFAWENDRIAFRMYGKALEWETVSPGIDVWCKKVRYPIVNNMYKNLKTYHTDQGESLDCYKVGPTLGCGGLGIIADDKLVLSRNYRQWKLITTGPIRTTFELVYETWEAGTAKVRETKQVSLDKGSNLNRIQSVMTCSNAKSLSEAAGIVVRGGQEQKTLKPGQNWLSYWFAPDDKNGIVGCGVVMTPGTKGQFKEQYDHLLCVVDQPCGKPLVYYSGACWDKGLDFKTADQWETYLSDFSKRLGSPIEVKIQ